MRHKYSLIQKTEKLSLDELADIARYALSWVENKLGVNKRHKIRHSLIISDFSDELMGVYYPHPNKIIIYSQNNKYIRDFIQTIIHEYTHTLQPIKTKYSKYSNLPREENPYEVEAMNNEIKLYRACWKEVRKHYQIK